MKVSRPLTALAFLFLAAVVLIFLLADLLSFGGGCVGVVKVEGPIMSESPSFFASIASGQAIAKQLRGAKDNPEVSVVLLEVNSPGGSAVASKEVFDAVQALEKPVVAYLGEVAASGGYYVAAPADYIVANPNTITGSIGARATILNYEELFEKLGLREETIKTGEMKDVGSGSRNLTPEERQLLQDIIQETFENFKADVELGRQGKLTAAYNEALDARILSAKMALNAGLVDELGTRQRALEKAMELGKLEEELVCDLTPPATWTDLFASMGASFGSGFLHALQSSQKPVLEYS